MADDSLPKLTKDQAAEIKAWREAMRERNMRDVRERAALSIEDKWRELNELYRFATSRGMRPRPEPSNREREEWIRRRELFARRVRT